MRHINEIIIHATATPPDWRAMQSTAQKVAEVRRWHVQERGWSDIGYHFLIDRDGTVAKGRPVERQGAHVAARNEGTIGIALFGGKGGSERDTFGTHYTPDQETALRNLVISLMADYPTIRRVSGHNEFAAKACPCFHVPTWWKMGRTTPKPPATEHARSWWGDLLAAILALFGKAKP